MGHLQGVDGHLHNMSHLHRDLNSAPASRRCRWLCGGADGVQHAVGDQPLEQTGALERADRSLLLGRVLAVPERAAVLGRLVKHRVAEEEEELWLVWAMVCQMSIHALVRELEWRAVAHVA